MTLTIQSLLFLAAVYLIFIIKKGRHRPYILLLASLIYIGTQSGQALCMVLAMTIFAYIGGLVIGCLAPKMSIGTGDVVPKYGHMTPALVSISCVVTVVLLIIMQKTGSIPVMLGFSYYGFQTISYFVDVNKGKTKVIKNPCDLALYLTWFPKFISGPIERAEDFVSQKTKIINAEILDGERISRAMLYISTGMFMKLMIADRLSFYASRAFEGTAESALMYILGALSYTFQIYTDFAGYSYAAYGISTLFGITINENFSQPYFSVNITEFWRKWHMSLSAWLKDYIYIPLGGNRRGFVRKCLNTMVVFIVCGFWHGTGLNFLIWGGLHGVYSVIDQLFRKRNLDKLRSGLIGWILTFASVSFAWIFFGASSMSGAVRMVLKMITKDKSLGALQDWYASTGQNPIEIWILLIAMLILIIFEIISQKAGNIPKMLATKHVAIRCLYTFVILVIVMIFGMYGSDAAAPIYMAF